MAKLYFICGFIGSGKTTYANELSVSQSAFRFSIDEWMIPLYGEHMSREDFNKRLTTLTELFKTSATQLMSLKVSVIFDIGFWNKSARNEITQWAIAQGFDYEMIYLNCSFEICKQRALKRNYTRSDKSYEMNAEMLDMFWQWFEVPSKSEQVTVINVIENEL